MTTSNTCFTQPKILAKFFAIMAFLSCAFLSSVQAQLLAFPTAEGFGKYATGGRGGKVVAVVNTNDTGVGSFRWAVLQYPTFPLTVVFRVSGIISLKSDLKINRSNLTIAGQTAPGDGICFKDNSVEIDGASASGNAGNIIVRYIRFRPGAPIYLGATGLNLENVHDVIIDHCSFSWANEENAAIYDSKNMTIQWCISSEGLYNAWHHKGSRSYSGVWGGQFSSLHHNLIAHCNTRTIRYDGSRAHDTLALVDSRNNVIYNSHSSNSCYGGEGEIPGGYSHVNLINCTYKPGPATPSNWVFVHASWGAAPDSNYTIGRWHLAGNKMIGVQAKTDSNYLGLDLSELPVANRPFARSDSEFVIPAWAQVNMQTADSSYALVMAGAGAILPKRDSTDSRVINETMTATATGTGSYPNGIPANSYPYANPNNYVYPAYAPSIGHGIIDTPSVVGGWHTYNSTTAPVDQDHDGIPDSWELCRGLNPLDSADGNRISFTGYTELEDYLNGVACTPTGIKNVTTTANISLFPNPAHNNLTVTYPAAGKGATISVINIVTGQKAAVYNLISGSEQLTFDVSALIPGGYSVLFLQGTQRSVATFIKR